MDSGSFPLLSQVALPSRETQQILYMPVILSLAGLYPACKRGWNDVRYSTH